MKSLWAAAKERGMSLGVAVELLKANGHGVWGTSTVKAAVDGKSKDVRELALRKVLLGFLSIADSANDGLADSVMTGVEINEQKSEYQAAVDWRERALKAEAEVERLRTALHEMTKPVSYGKNVKKTQ
jgi:hypothetical protein